MSKISNFRIISTANQTPAYHADKVMAAINEEQEKGHYVEVRETVLHSPTTYTNNLNLSTVLVVKAREKHYRDKIRG